MQVEGLLDTFKDAREYGSILNVDACDWDVLERFVDDLGTTGQISFESVGSEETQESLRKLVRVAKNLGQKYDAVVTNPPYMGASNMNPKLNDFIKKNYFEYKSDFFSAFVIQCSKMTKKYGYCGFFTPYVWMFIQSYEKMRNYLYTKATIETLIQFEYSAFEEATVPVCTFVFQNCYVQKKGGYMRLVDFRGGMEVQRQKTLEAIGNHNCGFYYEQSTDNFTKIPGSPVAYWVSNKITNLFGESVNVRRITLSDGQNKTGNNDKFIRKLWEVDIKKVGKSQKWVKCSRGGGYRKWYGNIEEVIDWSEDTRNHYHKDHVARIIPEYIWFRKGFTWSRITSAKTSFRLQSEDMLFEMSGLTLFTSNDEEMYWLISYLNSKVGEYLLRIITQVMTIQLRDVQALPVINSEELDKKVIFYSKGNISLTKMDWDSFETSCDFKNHPLIQKVSIIAEAFEQWKNECKERFNQLKASEEELNRIFIDIYGLQDELTPEVEDKDITVRKADLGREIRSFISYAVGCMFGRYSLDKEGLIYAGGNFNNYYKKEEEVLADVDGNPIIMSDGAALVAGEYYGKIKTDNGWRELTYSPDFDNCIPITDEEYFSDDIVARFVEFVETVYGEETREENLDFIANALGNKGDTSREVIRNYFLKDFYADHLKVYQKRPIYWLFDSGKQNGFKALIYMHRYDADTVGRVRTDYLHRAQKYVETAMQSAQYTIENASSASEKSKATKAVTKYTKQLAEMKIYDEAIAHIANKRIEIDLDDGVKVNYEKFQGVEVAQEGKKALKVDLLAKIK